MKGLKILFLLISLLLIPLLGLSREKGYSINDRPELSRPLVDTTFKISGYITDTLKKGILGVNVQISSSSVLVSSASTDAAGYYEFQVKAGLPYIITPSKQDYTFTPLLLRYNILKTDFSNQNFIGRTKLSFKVSGYVKDSAGKAIPAVQINISGDVVQTKTTDASGYYEITVPSGDNITVTPTKSGYTFSPKNKSYTSLMVSQSNQDFIALPAIVYSRISGFVRNVQNQGIRSVTITLSGDGNGTKSTDSNGLYNFAVQSGKNYTITPSKAGYKFDPLSKSFALLKSDVTQNFLAQPIIISYKISGNVTDSLGTPLRNVLMTLSGDSTSFKSSDSLGSYQFTVPGGKNYTITPTKFGYVFDPVKKIYSTINSDQPNQNFIAKLSFVSSPVPKPVAPQNNSIDQLTTLKMEWNCSSDLVMFHLQVALDSTFNRIILNDSLINRKYRNYDKFLNGVKYFWRIRSYNIFGKSAWSEVWNYTTVGVTIQTPKLFYPFNNSVNIPLSPIFSWISDSSVKIYSIAISSDSSLKSIIFVDTTLTKNYKQVGPLNSGTTYFWSVRAQKGDTKSLWVLPPWKFTTINITLSPPNLKTPLNNALLQTTNIRLEWDSIANIRSYTLQVSTDTTFSNPLINTLLTTNRKTIGPLKYNTTYYWRVRAENTSGISSWSSIWMFKIGSQIPLPPTLQKPNNYAVDLSSNISFEWKSDSSAASYHLQIAKDILFSSPVFNDSTITNASRQVSLLPGIIYYWRVSTKNPNGKSNWSNIWKFSTKSAGPEAPKLLSPPNSSTKMPLSITLSWSSLSNVRCYHLQAATDTGFRNRIINDSLIFSTSKEIGPLEVGTKYYWRVKANYGTEKSNWTNWWEFTTITPTLNTPLLISPADNSSDQLSSVTFNWDLVNNATYYKLQVSLDSLFKKNTADTIVTTNSIKITKLPIGLKFFWRVQAANLSEFSDWSSVWSFTTALTIPSIPKLASPINNISNFTVEPYLAWFPVYGASKYQVQLSDDSTFTIIAFDDTIKSKNLTQVGTLDFNTRYFWRVKAINNIGASEWSDVWHFTTIMSAPPAVTLSFPTDGSMNIPITPGPTLIWLSLQNIRAYQVQISIDQEFSKIILDRFLTDIKYQIKNLSSHTTYYWRVRPYNTGGKGHWSSIWSFTTTDGLPSNPILIVPSNGATGIDTSVRLRWISKGKITSYSLEVSTDPDFKTTLIYQPLYSESSIKLSNLIYATTYYWRVKARNDIGESEWVVSQFTTLAAEREQKNWNPSGASSAKPPKITCLQKDMFGFIYAGGDSGVYRSPAGQSKWEHYGINWDEVNYVSDLTISSSGDVFAAAIDGIWRLISGENIWKHVYFSTESSKISILPNGNLLGSLGNGIILSSDNGDNWMQISNLPLSGQSSCQNISALYLNPNGAIYVGTSINTDQCQSGVVDVLKSITGGSNWVSLGFNSKDNASGISAITSNNSGDLFIGTSGGSQSAGAAYKYSNGVWSRLSLDGQKISFITSLPNGDMYASVQSENSEGILFKNFDVYNKNKISNLLSGKGVSKSKDGGKTWEQANEGLVDTKASTINTTEDGKIYIGTADDGVYEGQYSTINKAPYFTTIINDTTIYKNQVISVPVTAADINQDKVAFKLLNAPGGATLEQIGSYTCLFKWTPAENQSGIFSNIMITVTDVVLSDTLIYSITVSTVNSQPVFAVKINDTTILENQSLTFNISAYDPENNSLTFTEANFPAGARLNYVNQNERSFYWKPGYGEAGVYNNLQINISNGILSANQNFSITVRKEDRAPSTFTLNSPVKSDIIQLEYPVKPIQFSWNPSSDPDMEDAVNYRFRLKGPTIDTTIYGISGNSFSFSGMDLLKVSSDYYWFILASDGLLLTSSDTAIFRTSQKITGEKKTREIPTSFTLSQNYPNPFNPSTKIQFGLPKTSVVSLIIYNSLGQKVRALISSESYDAGIWNLVWDGKNDGGRLVSTGIYFYRLNTPEFVNTRKMILMK